MLRTGSGHIDAELAFAQAARARRRADLMRRLRREPAECAKLAVYNQPSRTRAAAVLTGVHEIPLDAISGTLEPSRARLFDGCFRPAPVARHRWQRLWLAEDRGGAVPPISVVQVGNTYAVRDGHHRVSVARARGAVTIDAVVETV
jgi:hypothetical protein